MQGNTVGTNRDGTAPIANDGFGIKVDGGASGNTIGGATAAHRNVIADSREANGIRIDPAPDKPGAPPPTGTEPTMIWRDCLRSASGAGGTGGIPSSILMAPIRFCSQTPDLPPRH